VEVDGQLRAGFPTPSRKLEFFSKTLKDWKWPEQAVPGYVRSQVHWANLDRDKGEMALLPTFRLPTLIHTRSGNAKWLTELSHTNPIWVHPQDARRLGVETGDLLKVETAIGAFVDRAWVTEGLRPGIIACSHHIGRWRLAETSGGGGRTALVDLKNEAPGGGGCARSTASAPSRARSRHEPHLVGRGRRQPEPRFRQPDPISGQHAGTRRCA
jgi:anaerobic selenocysteine-containing dehydrogenase